MFIVDIDANGKERESKVDQIIDNKVNEGEPNRIWNGWNWKENGWEIGKD